MRIKAVLAAWMIGVVMPLIMTPARGESAGTDVVPAPRRHVRPGAGRAAGRASDTAPLAAESADDPESRPLTQYRRPDTRVAADEDSGSVMMSIAGKLALVVALILACAAVWKRFQGGLPHVGQPVVQPVRLTSTMPLGPQRFLHLITLGRHQLLLGSTPQSISLIAALDETSSLVGGPGISASPAANWVSSMAETDDGPHESMGMADGSPADRFEELLMRLRDLEAESEDDRRPPRRRDGGTRSDNRWNGTVEPRAPTVGRGGAHSDYARSAESARVNAWDRSASDEEAHFAGPAAGVVAEALGPGSLFRSSGRGPRAGGNA